MLELENVIDRQLIAGIQSHVGQAMQLAQTPVEHPAPRGKSWQRGFKSQPSAKLVRGLGERDRVAAPGEGQCAFESGRTASDNQHGRAAARGSVALRMPPTAPLLAYGRVLGTSHRHTV